MLLTFPRTFPIRWDKYDLYEHLNNSYSRPSMHAWVELATREPIRIPPNFLADLAANIAGAS